jgi:hypothetical protein
VLVYAAIDFAQLTALAIGVFGLAGIVFTALRFRRDDTTAVVSQQAQITSEMKILSDELRASAERLRNERDACYAEVAELRSRNA